MSNETTTPAANDILADFGTGTSTGKAKRYTLDPARTLTLTDGTTHLERVGAGVLSARPDTGGFLVHEKGDAQSALPLRAVGNAVLSGEVIPFDVLAAMLVRTGKAGEMQKALAAEIKRAKDAAGA
jgi:hypothetical protein